MPGKFVALLRGINVGRAKRVPMADLRAIVEDLGYSDVRTLLNSGNIVFTDRSSAQTDATTRIEHAIASRLEISTRVTVLSASELVALVRDNPLLDVADNPSRLLVAVPSELAELAPMEPLLEQEWAPEILALGPRAAYLWCPDGILASRLLKTIGNVSGDSLTTRNWRTTMKIYEAIGRDPEQSPA